MMKKILLIIILSPVIFLSCSKDKIEIDPSNLLLGVWQYSGYSGDLAVFERTNDFSDNHCYRFNADGTLTERKNSGWCGTPPITYADYAGSWRILNDTLIHVSVGYWGGVSSYRIGISSLSETTLKAIFVYSN